MANLIIDGGFSAAQINGSPFIFSAPITGVSTQYVMKQKFCIQKDSFSPIAIGTAHPTLSGYFLTAESALENLGGGIVQWEREYAQIPASHDEPSSLSYNFIGLNGVFGSSVLAITGRPRFTQTVGARIQNDYFLLGGSTPTILSIPVVLAQRYYFGTDPTLQTDFLGDSPPFVSPSNPSRTAYLAMIAGGSEIVAQDSSMERWKGNIIVRKTVYIKAL